MRPRVPCPATGGCPPSPERQAIKVRFSLARFAQCHVTCCVGAHQCILEPLYGSLRLYEALAFVLSVGICTLSGVGSRLCGCFVSPAIKKIFTMEPCETFEKTSVISRRFM